MKNLVYLKKLFNRENCKRGALCMSILVFGWCIGIMHGGFIFVGSSSGVDMSTFVYGTLIISALFVFLFGCLYKTSNSDNNDLN